MNIPNIEQQIADRLFLQHGQVLINGRVDGVVIGVDIDRPYKAGGFFAGRGELRVKIGDSAYTGIRPTNFRMKEDNTFSIDKIADKLHETFLNIIANNKRITAERNKLNSAEQIVSTLQNEFGMSRYSSTLYANFKTKSAELTFRRLNESQLKTILQAAKDAGVQLS